MLALCMAGVARAQVSAVPDPVQYLISPETPGPNQQVRIVAQGIGSFLGDATITWAQNGKTVLSGVGETDFSFTTGALGTQTHIQARVVSSSQGTFTKDFVFFPSLVNLVWEADTTAPPMYRGKSLYSGGSNLKVVAFPLVFINGARVSPNNLSMQWSRSNEAVPSASGIGKTSFSFVGDQLQNQENISVEVYYGASKIGYGQITIPVSNPLLLFYSKDPLRGTLYDAALPAAISLTTKEITVQAAPYFFASSSFKKGALVYSWTLNGEDSVGPDSAKGMLTLRQTGSGQGAAVIGAALQNNEPDKFIQTAQAALQIVFGSSSNSLFGL